MDSKGQGQARPSIILDRDGVINEIVWRQGLISSPRTLSELKVRQDFRQFMGAISTFDFGLLVASNQPDVKRGHLSSGALDAITQDLHSQFPAIIEFAYCTHDDSDHCQCRKPKPGLVQTLIDKHGLARGQTIFCGDSHKDVLAAQAAGIKSAFLLTSYNHDSLQHCRPDLILTRVVDLIPFVTQMQLQEV